MLDFPNEGSNQRVNIRSLEGISRAKEKEEKINLSDKGSRIRKQEKA